MTQIAPSPPRVLFLCTGNSCRSQMAEAWLRALTAGRVTSLSAGTAPVGLNPRAIKAMAEVDIDLSSHSSDSIDDFIDNPPDLVIAVCSDAEKCCPNIPNAKFLAWPFDDPAHLPGADNEVMPEFRRVRDEIRERIESWLEEGLPLIATR